MAPIAQIQASICGSFQNQSGLKRVDLVAASAQTKAICFALKLRDFNSEGKVNGYFSSEQIVDRPRRPTPAMLLKLSLTALSR